MDLHKELLRIAETVENKKDREIIYAAAIKFIDSQPSFQELTKVPGYGYVVTSEYR